MQKQVPRKRKNWSTPGIDKFMDFDLNICTAKHMNTLLQGGQILNWLKAGNTCLLQKDQVKGETPSIL